MSSVGLRARQPVEDTMTTPDVAEYGEEVELGEVQVEPGSSVRARGTTIGKSRLYDSYGRERWVPTGAVNYYLGKRRWDDQAQKMVRVFSQRRPEGIPDPVAGEDFMSCEVCPLTIRLRPESKVPSTRKKQALLIEHATHMLTMHPLEALLYVDEDLQQRMQNVLRRNRR
jgi:hypothetical protein